MKQKTISQVLKGFSIMAGMIGGIVFFFMLSEVNDITSAYEEVAFLKWPAIVGMSVVVSVCYYALYEFWKVCTQIGNNNSFSKENVLSMKHIGYSALVVALFILIGDIYLAVVGWLHPGIIVVSLFFIFIASSFAVISLALSSLIHNALMIKEENDLTI